MPKKPPVPVRAKKHKKVEVVSPTLPSLEPEQIEKSVSVEVEDTTKVSNSKKAAAAAVDTSNASANGDNNEDVPAESDDHAGAAEQEGDVDGEPLEIRQARR